MNLSTKLALAAVGALLALSGAATAADLAKGIYEIDGYITASNCGPGVPKGGAIDQWAYYPGASTAGFLIATPTTSPSGGAGDASTTTCQATTAIPSTGLAGAALTLNCFPNTDAGAGTTVSSQLRGAKFSVGASHSPSVWQVSLTSNVYVGGKLVCSYTTDSTWTQE
jgi:hypothetical protein